MHHHYEPLRQTHGELREIVVREGVTRPKDTRVRVKVAATDYWRINPVTHDYEEGPRHWVVTISSFDYTSGMHCHDDVPFNYTVIPNGD